MLQLLLHGLGDYIIQNDWMALNKKKPGFKGFLACFIHCLTYSLPFLFIGSVPAVLFIFITHFIIDRTHIIDYILALKNGIYPDISNLGFRFERPQFVVFFIYVVVDNLFHISCNYFALTYL